MSIGVIVMIIVVALVVAAIAMVAWVDYGKRQLRSSFGPEYHRVAQELGSKKSADRELHRRVQTHDALALRPISVDDRKYFAASWDHVRGTFLDNPAVALNGAAELVARALDARGYPGDDLNEQLALLSVRHSTALAGYRQALRITEDAQKNPAAASTEAMRTALMEYHALFDDLLAAPGALTVPARVAV